MRIRRIVLSSAKDVVGQWKGGSVKWRPPAVLGAFMVGDKCLHTRSHRSPHWIRGGGAHSGLLPPSYSGTVGSVYAVLPEGILPAGGKKPHIALQNRPYITLIFLRGGAVIVSVFFAYIGIQVFNRLPFRQRSYIRNNMRKEISFSDGRAGHEQLWLKRPNKVDFLVSHLRGTPNGPLVVTGPEGSGKTGLLREILGERPNTLYVDMREHPVTSGHEFMEVFTRECGYLLPPNELLGRAIFTQAATLAKETDKALDSIVQVLKQLKQDDVWGENPPTICVDEITRIMSVSKETDTRKSLTEDKNFQMFLDWCIFLTSSRLAHVVLVCTPDIADEIDNRASFSMRRQKLHIDYPRNASVRAFFRDVVNSRLKKLSTEEGEEEVDEDSKVWSGPFEDAATGLEEPSEQPEKYHEPSPMKKAVERVPPQETPKPLADVEIDAIINSIGGHLNDIDVLIGQITQGLPWQEAVQRLLADSVQQVENLLESLYCCGDQRDSDHDAFLFQTPPESVYHNSWDLALKVTHNYKCFLRCFAMIELLAKRKWVHRQELANQIFPDCPSEIDDYVDRGILVCVNLNSSAKIVSGKESAGASHGESGTDIDLSRLGVHGRYVSSATPRLRTAFRAVCQNRRMLAIRQRIRSKVQLHSLRAREQHLSHELQELSILYPMAMNDDQLTLDEKGNNFNTNVLRSKEVNQKAKRIQHELHEVRDTISRVIDQLTQSALSSNQRSVSPRSSTSSGNTGSGQGSTSAPETTSNSASKTNNDSDNAGNTTAISPSAIVAPTPVVTADNRLSAEVVNGDVQTFSSVSPWWSIGDASIDPDEDLYPTVSGSDEPAQFGEHTPRWLRIGW